jgi:hypothetical protein
MNDDLKMRFELFECRRLGARISKKACIEKRSFDLSDDRIQRACGSLHMVIDRKMSPCRICHVGTAHANGEYTPEWKCPECGGDISRDGCISCNARSIESIKNRMENFDVNARQIIVKQKNCLLCGELFLPKSSSQKYCSSCKGKGYSKNIHVKKPYKAGKDSSCIVCGKPFYSVNARKSCSPQCTIIRQRKVMSRSHAERRSERQAENTRKCAYSGCDVIFVSRYGRRYHSDECKRLAGHERDQPNREEEKA